jgi:CxxC motif-containing protein (DUF1111 family)/cytochrome c553
MRCTSAILLLPLVAACSWDNVWEPPDGLPPRDDSDAGGPGRATAPNRADASDLPTESSLSPGVDPASLGEGETTHTSADASDTVASLHPVSTSGAPSEMAAEQTPVAAWGSCGEQLPASFVVTCSGCHTATGAANSRYPDLYDFKGDMTAFLAKVRGGGGAMSAYSEQAITDAEVRAVYEYFTATGTRTSETVAFDGVETLFTPSDVNHPPIVFTRADGVLITRGAGRVRQRHESEGTFNPFGPHYFEDRSYGFLVEDYTPLGESLIRVSYLPVAMPTDGTNFRAWKIYGDGNVFYANSGMDPGALPALESEVTPTLEESYRTTVAEFATVQVKESSNNPRTDRPIEAGDIFEFEFGIFIEADAVRENSRTSYYTDTFRYQVGVGGLTARSDDTNGQLGPALEAQQGGSGTNVWLYEDAEFAFEQMALNIQHENVQSFLRGRRLFHTDFDSGEHSEGGNPVFEEQQGKLGPLFAAKRCETCHIHNGPGGLLRQFDEDASTVFKLYDGQAFGGQLQLQEGEVQIATAEVTVFDFPDGSSVNLTRPRFDVTAGDAAVDHFSARISRKVIGLGLLEAMTEEAILSRADPNDCNQDGISGRPFFVVDPETSRTLLGRFGWKAEKVSIRHQVIDALDADLGVGTNVIPDSEGHVELGDSEVDDLTTYMRLLSVPAQRDVASEGVTAGLHLFQSIGCSACHVTDAVTGSTHPFVELRSQAIKPYTDLLLHDMGPELADMSGVVSSEHEPRSPPGAREWRTPPLWGLGLYATVNGNTGLLHDGRAGNALEAVLWHGGEAQSARDRFAELEEAQRAQLLQFLESL